MFVLFLFTLYAADSRHSDNSRPMIKLADYLEITGNIKNDHDSVYMEEINNFVTWCDDSYLYLNVSRTRVMCTDFRKNRSDQDMFG